MLVVVRRKINQQLHGHHFLLPSLIHFAFHQRPNHTQIPIDMKPHVSARSDPNDTWHLSLSFECKEESSLITVVALREVCVCPWPFSLTSCVKYYETASVGCVAVELFCILSNFRGQALFEVNSMHFQSRCYSFLECDEARCSVDKDRRFGRSCCLHQSG